VAAGTSRAALAPTPRLPLLRLEFCIFEAGSAPLALAKDQPPSSQVGYLGYMAGRRPGEWRKSAVF